MKNGGMVMSEEYMQYGILFDFPLDKSETALLNYSLSCEINIISVGVVRRYTSILSFWENMGGVSQHVLVCIRGVCRCTSEMLEGKF